MSSRLKTILFLIALFIVSLICLNNVKLSPTSEYDAIDNTNYNKFKIKVRHELHNAVDIHLDDFFEDLTGWNAVCQSAKDCLGIGEDNKEKYISDVWNRHYNIPFSSIVEDRVQLLVNDMYTTNALCIENLEGKGVNVEGFDKKIKDALDKSINDSIYSISNRTINRDLINDGIAVAAGVAAGLVVSNLFKSHFITAILSLGVDAIVTIVVENKLENDLKLKLRKEIIAAVDESLYNDYGLFPSLKESIDKFHIIRARAWNEAYRQNQST